VKKFLATSAFLQINGKNRLTTSDITKALKEANQTKIGNPSEYLNQNVKKGHCEKDGSKDFFVTSHGFEYLGITL
jgi:predicted transcriptional regulator